MKHSCTVFFGFFFALGLSARADLAIAQAIPDAGALRQQIEQGRDPGAQRVVPQPDALEAARPLPPPALTGVRIQVSSLRFVGNYLLDAAQLQSAVQSYLNRPMDYGQLQGALAAVMDQYRRSGWVVRAFFPEQEIVDGVVTMQIVEAGFGRTRVDQALPPRVDLARIQSIIDTQQSPGAVLNTDALDRAVLLVDDLPGVGANGTLTEGEEPGQTDLLLRLSSKPLLSGEAIADNAGNRSTGPVRLGVNAALNSAFGRGDLLSANLMQTEGSDYLRLGASVPLGSDGWRVGLNAYSLHYQVLLSEFAALNARGSSDSLGLEASYPWIRSRVRNLYFSANLDDTRYDNQAGGVRISHYRASTLSLGLWGNAVDRWAGGGSNTASLVWTPGQLDLAGSASQAADAAGARTEGHFNRLRYSFVRQQTLHQDLQLYAALSGQMADKNLDSSEKFYLGGAYGVRAYPGSEAGGANGQLLSLELRQRLPQGFGVSAFYDIGQVSSNVDNRYTGAPATNDSTLRGFGLGLGWQHSSGLVFRVSWSRRVGDHPNPAVSGTDQDGSLVLDRWWFMASMPF